MSNTRVIIQLSKRRRLWSTWGNKTLRCVQYKFNKFFVTYKTYRVTPEMQDKNNDSNQIRKSDYYIMFFSYFIQRANMSFSYWLNASKERKKNILSLHKGHTQCLRNSETATVSALNRVRHLQDCYSDRTRIRLYTYLIS